MGVWKVLLPETSINMVLNPVAMGATGFTAVGAGSITAVSTYSYLGYKCYRLTATADNTGAYFDLSALSNNIHYMTLRIRSNSDIVTFDCSLDNANFYEPTLLGTEGDWWVYGYSFLAVQANASTKLYIQQKGAAGAPNIDMWIGHIQVEQKTYATSPITGDVKGFTTNGYYWNGAAHTSSSVRTAQERSGGVETDLETAYNFRVLYGEGSGMPPITHHIQGMALLPGALYQGHKVETRVLDLVSATKANTVALVAKARKDFINAVKIDKVSPEQPVVFRYSAVNVAKPVDFYCYYDSGMEFQTSSGIVDHPVARFICYDPFVYETHTESKAMTTVATTVGGNANYVARKINGVWYNISTDFDGNVRAFTKGADGCIYIGGNFTIAGNMDYIAKWNPYTSALSALGTGMTAGEVRALATASNGDIYAGGVFTDAGGVAATNNIAFWNIDAGPAVWTTVGGGITTGGAGVYALVFDHGGKLYVGGSFINQHNGNGDRIASWDGTSWDVLGSGMDGIVYAMAVSPNNSLYVGGDFAHGDGVVLNGIGMYNGTTFVPLGAGLNGGGACYALVADKAGNIYAGGFFTTADGVACTCIAKWNGKTFEPLGSGLNGICYALAIDDNGLLYASGVFTTAGGITVSYNAVWNGTTWAHLDADLPAASTAYTILPGINNLYIGYNTAGIAYTSYLNATTNSGSTAAYPIIKIYRADDGTYATVEWFKNETTGDTLWCNYALLKGETLTIDLTPGNRSIKSDYFGDVWRAVLRSSDLSSFNLLPGVNNISVFVMGDGNLTCWAEWPITHWAADNSAA